MSETATGVNATGALSSLHESAVGLLEAVKPYGFEEFYLSLGLMIAVAALMVWAGARRGLAQHLRGRSGLAVLSDEEVSGFPFEASKMLFLLYLVLRYIPSDYIGKVLLIHFTIASVAALNAFLRHFIPNHEQHGCRLVQGAKIVVALSSILIGLQYIWTRHWLLSNLATVALGVTAIQTVTFNSFKNISILLIALFFYDIFWVFGTDVMLTVATSIDGPIKIILPQKLITDFHGSITLLGLGDIVIPGFFIAYVHRFDKLVSSASAGPLSYTTIAMAAYVASLVNTMAVMIIFKHGQPALLFIVPWLLVATLLLALAKGELGCLLRDTLPDDPTDDEGSESEDEETHTALLDQVAMDLADAADGRRRAEQRLRKWTKDRKQAFREQLAREHAQRDEKKQGIIIDTVREFFGFETDRERKKREKQQEKKKKNSTDEKSADSKERNSNEVNKYAGESKAKSMLQSESKTEKNNLKDDANNAKEPLTKKTKQQSKRAKP